MNIIDSVNSHIEHSWEGLDFLIRDKSNFHARDVSVVFKSKFAKDETDLRKLHNLATEKVEGKCLRALFYDFQKQVVTNPTESSGIRTMDIGNACEDMERDYYKSLGIFQSAHIRMFNKDYLISGEVDNLIWEYEDILLPDGHLSGRVKICEPRRLIGVEVKSFWGYYAEKEILVNGIPKWNHVLQALIYLDHYKPNIPYWLLVYLSRGGGVDTPNGRMFGRQFKLQISKLTGEIFIDGMIVKEFKIEDVYGRFKKAQFLIENNKLPDRDYVYNYPKDLVELKYKKGEIGKSAYGDWQNGNKYISDWQCSYCGYLYQCWKDVFGNTVRGAPKEVLGVETKMEATDSTDSGVPKG